MFVKAPNLLLILLSILLIACAKEEESPITESDLGVPTIEPTGEEAYLNENSDYIYDQDELRTYELKIPESALEQLDADPAAEEYVEGMLIFEGDTISPVGVRYKGSVGAFVGCVSGSDWFNPSGSKTCTKLSMKVKIDWGDRQEKFFKLKKLQFHSMNLDPSQMHERLGYWLFREMGIPSPRAVHAKLIVNNTFVGLFSLTEQIDNRFVKYNYNDQDGNLYKEIWPLNMAGVPYHDTEYLSALKTNENNNPSIALIKNFGVNLSQGTTEEGRAIVEQYMDLDKIITYAAVDRVIRHDDGPFHWYCNGNDCSNHNYYWYEEPTKQKLHLIPWDLDNAFDNIISNANPITPIADEWGMTSNDCRPFQHLGARQWSAACDKLTAIWASYDELYLQKKQALIKGPLSQEIVNQQLDKWSDQIQAATLEAQEKYGDAVTINQWEEALMNLKDQLEFARNN